MDGRFLRSRVARRVLAYFFLGAVVPVVLVAGLSYVAVTGQLKDQSHERLDGLAKSGGMAVVERIWYAHQTLSQMVSLGLVEDTSVPLPAVFRGVGIVRAGTVSSTRGVLGVVPLGPSRDGPAGGEDRPGVRIAEDGAPPDLLISLPGAEPGEVIWGRVMADSLWTRAFAAVALSTTSGICILDATRRPVACGLERAAELAGSLVGAPPIDDVEVLRVGTDDHLVAGWQIYLPSSFDAEPWYVVVSESREMVFGPIRTFSRAFPLALVLGLALVSLLANVQIRRTMEPLDRLTEGTERIVRGDLSTPVVVDTDDEFSELAGSFNAMAGALATQFRLLDAGRAIDEVALTRLEGSAVLDALLEGGGRVLPGRPVAGLRRAGDGAWQVSVPSASGSITADAGAPLSRRLLHHASRGANRVRLEWGTPEFEPLARAGFGPEDSPASVFLVRTRGTVRGALAVGSVDGGSLGGDEQGQLRSLVARASVGLQSARLVEELEEMSWGTLRALARAIDAKSPWTAGHSERVSALGLALGLEMGLGDDDMGILERGGLLHDVGKIGVPASILDYPGPLTDEQFDVMRQHPVIGARILEPIEAFRSALPIVRSHHERWDGGGYPDGLRGREIHPLARILAVADVFDAMVSERPYRSAIATDIVHERIRSEAGVAFEVQVVEALTSVLEQGWDHANSRLRGVQHAL